MWQYASTSILPRVVIDGIKYVVFGKNVVIHGHSNFIWMMRGCEMAYLGKKKRDLQEMMFSC